MTHEPRDINRSMYDYIPNYYEEIRESRAIIDAESAQFTKLNADINDVLAQFFIDTATWGLTAWERFVGDKQAGAGDITTFQAMQQSGATFADITNDPWYKIETKYPMDVEQRRANLRAKVRGFGTVTSALIKSVAESYANGAVEIAVNSVGYTVTIKFVGELGVPAKIGDIQTALREIIPAHLAINYEFKYVTYDQSEATYATYDALTASGKTYDDILNGR